MSGCSRWQDACQRASAALLGDVRRGTRGRASDDVAATVRNPTTAHAPRRHDSGWAKGLLGVLVAGCIVVPCVFTTRLQAAFIVPKLGVLWAMLALSLALIAFGALRSATFPGAARPIWFVDVVAVSFVALSIAAWAFSTDHEQSLYGERLQHQGLLTVLLYVGFFYVARLSVTDIRRLRLLFWAIAIGAALVSGYALVQKAGFDPIWEGYLPGGRVFSSIGQANALAAYLVLAIPVSAALLFGTTRRMRVAVLLATATMVAAFVFARSRGGYLGLLAVLVVLAIGWRHELGTHSRRAIYGLAVVVAAGAAVGALARAPSFTEEFRRLASSDDSSVRFHLDAWKVAAEIVREHPVVGTGPETFPDVFPRYSHRVLPPDRASALDAFRVESPHNVYLTVAVGSGIPALVAYLGVIAGFFLAVLRAARTVTREVKIALVAVLAGAAAHLVTDAFITADVTSTWLFWVAMGATLGLISSGAMPARGLGR